MGATVATSDPYWGSKALAFVDSVRSAATPSEIMNGFGKAIAEVGFHAYIMAGIPVGADSLDQTTLANGWPAEWFSLYVRENYAKVDPIPRHSLRSLDPFEWREAPYDRDGDIAARTVMDRALDFRFNEGLCVPIHYDNGAAAISMAGETAELTPDSKGALHLMSVFAHGRIRSLLRPVARTRMLNDIEAEVLTWAAAGKTVWETSVILDISERNAKYHLAEAQRKLGAANRTAAVAQALVKNEIAL